MYECVNAQYAARRLCVRNPFIWDFNLYVFLICLTCEVGARGGAVVEALCYKPEGRGIDSRWCYWNFSLT
jgi:hypothetical protein